MTSDQLRIQELEIQVADMRRLLDGLINSSQIDPLVAKTINIAASIDSSKLAATATRTVNESGASSYTVMYAPDGFKQIGGLNFPYFN